MAPKKKRGGKFAKMTEEERLIYLEQQRLAEEEMRKKKEDMLVSYLREKLAKENKATTFNLNKLNHQWRNIMRESKSKELKKDIEILSQTFERIIDRKESVIKTLVKDLQEAEEQYEMAHRSHLQSVDHLIALQTQRLNKLEEEYEAELAVVREEFDVELELMSDLNSREMIELQDILFAMEQSFRERDDWMKSEFQSMRDELKNKNLEEKHALRGNLEFTVEGLWGQFHQALRTYKENTEERKTAFESLRAKDADSAKMIEQQMRKIQRLNERIAQLKAKMAANTREHEERNRHLKEQKERMQAYFQDLKSQMNRMRENNREALTTLTVNINGVLTEQKHRLQLGERVLRFAEMCRKLETEEEKVLPFYVNSLTEEEQADVNSAVAEEAAEKLVEVMHDYKSLEMFWKRYNKVRLDVVALGTDRNSLMSENQQLRALLKQYLDGISVNDEVMAQINPLFVVNCRTNANLSPSVSDVRVERSDQKLIIEAATHVKHVELPGNLYTGVEN